MKQHGKTVQDLERLSAAELVVEVQCDVAGEYVFIDVPIPAGCSYGPSANRNPHETHREQFRNRTGIFCEFLPTGKHVFRIPLEVRFSGSFTVNPGRVELMYFPMVFGRNGMNRVEVR